MTGSIITLEEKALHIIKRLRLAGHEAYYAGGAVRDRLRGETPNDIDIATAAPAEEVLKLFERAEAIGAAFGVVLVKGDGPPIEVATFRIDGPYRDGRRPEWVMAANAMEDAQRRDFTINGMFYEPLTDQVVDYVNGRPDLEAGIVRAIGDPETRFAEDYLRMFRAVRFACRLGFEIDPVTWTAIKRHAEKAGRLAAERVRDELTRILTGPDPGRGLRLLHAGGLLEWWLPEVEKMAGTEQNPEHHPEGDVMTHTALVLDALERPNDTLAWGALLHDVGKPATTTLSDGRIVSHRHANVGAGLATDICKRLKMSNKACARIASLVGDHMRFMDYPNMRESTRRRLFAMPHFPELLALYRADTLAGGHALDTWEAITRRIAETPTRLPEPLLSGEDLKALGLSPGPHFAEILEAVRIRQLDGELADKAQALRFVREHLGI